MSKIGASVRCDLSILLQIHTAGNNKVQDKNKSLSDYLSIHHKNPEDPVINDHIWTSKCDVSAQWVAIGFELLMALAELTVIGLSFNPN